MMPEPKNNLEEVLRRQPLQPSFVYQTNVSGRSVKSFKFKSSNSFSIDYVPASAQGDLYETNVFKLDEREVDSQACVSQSGASSQMSTVSGSSSSQKRSSPCSSTEINSKTKRSRLKEHKENIPEPILSSIRSFPKYADHIQSKDSVGAGQLIPNDKSADVDHDNLCEKSVAYLQRLLHSNIDHHSRLTNFLLEFHCGSRTDTDVYVLQQCLKLIEDRITAIRTLICQKGDSSQLQMVSSEEKDVVHNESALACDNKLGVPTLSNTNAKLAVTASDLAVSDFQDDIDVESFEHESEEKLNPTNPTVNLDRVQNAAAVDQNPSQTTHRVDQTSTPYYAEALKKLKTVFRLDSFRQNQLEAINATLAGRDVFVLMPTGGGKSLCYQVPAVCEGGQTRGVTVVVSPLIALMIDQVRHLKEKNVDAVLFNSDQDTESSRATRNRLTSSGRKPSLLYVTPEKLLHSNDFKNVLSVLHRNGELARFVVDEAHCVSMWGRDFREAYQNLDKLKLEYPGIPIMALTATANSRVKKDVIDRLKITNCVFLAQSFNRPNLHYEIRKKPKNALADINAFIVTHYRDSTGIIYCLSRNKCEEVAKELRETYGLSAKHYHAQMSVSDKNRTQEAWQSGECKIVVATIAFGMGIDKPDVRYVIHYSLPMTLDGYYQETGRAGRDGKVAHCILYYAYSDTNGNFKLIDDNEKLSPEEKQRQKDGVHEVVKYCKNEIDCRRVQVLQYFDQTFDAADCHNSCDNCMITHDVVEEDVSDAAKTIIQIAQSLLAGGYERLTRNHCIGVFRGSKIKDIRQRGHDQHELFGRGAHIDKGRVERVFDHLLSVDALRLESVQNNSGWNVVYLRLGKRVDDILDNTNGIRMRFKVDVKVAKCAAEVVKDAPMSVKNFKELKRLSYVNVSASPIAVASDATFLQGSIVEYQINASQPECKDANRSMRGSRSAIPGGILESGVTNHHQQLCKLRSKVARQYDIDDPERLLDTRTLGRICEILPTDVVSFKSVLMEMLQDGKVVEEKWNLIGKTFLNFCINASPSSDQTCKNGQDSKSYKFRRL